MKIVNLIRYRNPINNETVYTTDDPVYKTIDNVKFVQCLVDLSKPRTKWYKVDALQEDGVLEWTIS